MIRRRRTKAERDQVWEDAERRVWDQFRFRLEATSSFVDAQRLIKEAPPPDVPGRRYYSNLGFFLQNFTVPEGSSYQEKELYFQFIRQLDAAGELKPGAAQKVQEDLQRTMESGGS
jgi:hypothetical protein